MEGEKGRALVQGPVFDGASLSGDAAAPPLVD